jgi:3-deoxy-7-phosphoheptulonate synthase
MLRERLNASDRQLDFVKESRCQLRNILDGKDPRLALIVGPCSIHDIASTKEYAERLKKLSSDVSDKFLIIMRTYFEKPRTTVGWKGLVYDPHVDGSHNLALGLEQTRQILLALAENEVPVATEFLDPLIPRYIEDLVTWGCIGARTTESQVHRQFASGLSIPIAFKNSTSGDLDIAINAVIASSHPHTCLGINDDGQVSILRTKGNTHAHVVLRGGKNRTNFDPQSVQRALFLLEQAELPARILIDCSHGNSMKNHEGQIAVFESVIEQYIQGSHGIKGMLLESHIFDGNQKIHRDTKQLRYGVSLTDPCLSWDSTEQLIREGARQMRRGDVSEQIQRCICDERVTADER